METLIIVVAIILVGVLVQYLVRKFSYIVKPPLRIHLVRRPAGKGSSKGFQKHGADLKALGFTPIGTYRISEMAGMVLAAFSHKQQAVCAVIYSHPLTGCFVDMFSENEEGVGLTVSNARAGQVLDQPPGREKIIDKTLTVRNIYDHLLKKRPQGPYKRIGPSDFAEVFQNEYAKEMDWRKKRGFVTDAEVRRAAQAMGIKSDSTIR
ncbi:MAG: hypothetical protein JSW58_16560, partial [Candidatus Latescibacterota bacterium]